VNHLDVFRVAAGWYGIASLIAWLVYPVIYLCLPGLPDRGVSIVRPLGLLLAAVGPWWLAALGLAHYDLPLIVAIPAAGAAIGWTVAIARQGILRFLFDSWRAILAFEFASLALFALYVAFRSYNPANAFTEKPMELAMLTSALQTHSMPPLDPWFAGKPINYYYLGYVIAALPARLSGIRASVAFNLELATLFAMATTAAAGAAWNLARLLRPGRTAAAALSAVLGGLLLVGIGNLVTPISLLLHPFGTLSAPWWQGVGWKASRVIVDDVWGATRPVETINEFPAFSYVLGDLHPHVLTYPTFISAIAIALGLPRARDSAWGRWGSPALGGLTLGCLYAMNSWDMPPALALIALALLLTTAPSRRWSLRELSWLHIARALAPLLGTMIIVAIPFLARYVSPLGANPEDVPAFVNDLPVIGTIARTIGPVPWPKSSPIELLKVHGLFLLALIPSLVLLVRSPRMCPPLPRRAVAVGLGVSAALALVTLTPAFLLFGFPLWLAMTVVLRPGLAVPWRLAGGAAGLAFLMLLLAEFFFLRDAFANRMNTVFKVYFQVWAMFAILTAALLPWLVATARRRVGGGRAALLAAAIGVTLLGSAVYPLLSAYRWTEGFDEFQGLDGLGYVSRSAPDAAAAIAWIRANTAADAVVLEAPGCSYGVSRGVPSDLIAMATGRPTLVGWDFHEYQWRNGVAGIYGQIQERQREAGVVYQSPGSPEAAQIIKRYDIRYVYVGADERLGYEGTCNVGPPYDATGLSRFADLGWPVAFRAGNVTLYAVPETLRSPSAGIGDEASGV
jgi:YYY domain-containing protein